MSTFLPSTQGTNNQHPNTILNPQNPVTPPAAPTDHTSHEFHNPQPNNFPNPDEITDRNATENLPETNGQGDQPIVLNRNSTLDSNKADLIEEINTIPGPETIIHDRRRKQYIIMDIASIAGAILFTAALIFIPALATGEIIMLAIAISSLIGIAITITLDLSTGIFGLASTISESQLVDKISEEFEAVNDFQIMLDFVTNINPIIRFVKFCWQPPQNLKGRDVYYLNRAVQLALLREKSHIASESSTLILKPKDDTLSFVDCNDPENPHQMSPQELKKNLEDIDPNVFVWMDHDLKKEKFKIAQNSEELIEKEFNKLTNATKAARLLIDKIDEDLQTTNDVQDTLDRCASRTNHDLDPQHMAAFNIYTPILNSFGENFIGQISLNSLDDLPKYLDELKKSTSLTKKITLARFDQVNQQYLLLKYLKNYLQKNSFIEKQLRPILNQSIDLDYQIREKLENILNNLDKY
nr:hypothetical protein [Opitutales bacterium]